MGVPGYNVGDVVGVRDWEGKGVVVVGWAIVVGGVSGVAFIVGGIVSVGGLWVVMEGEGVSVGIAGSAMQPAKRIIPNGRSIFIDRECHLYFILLSQ